MVCAMCSAFEVIDTRERLSVDEIHIKEGLRLVETFYEYLFSDTSLKDCPDIFVTDEIYLLGKQIPFMQRVETYHIWQYLRKNIPLFVLPSEEFHPPDQFFQTAAKGYSLQLTQSSIDSGLDSVVFLRIILSMSTRLENNHVSGIDKSIAFPISFCNNKQEYRIYYPMISVNGIYLDWSTAFHRIMAYDRNFERDFDLFEHLGFAK
jgi:hypothetical protein